MWGQALALPIIPETIKGKAYSHVSYRYLIVVINGVKNPYRRAVAKDVVDAIGDVQQVVSEGRCVVCSSIEGMP
jgi:hypothetical protein